MIVVETAIDIARPSAEVFDFVADQTNAPRWQHGLVEVERVTPGPIGVGTEHVDAGDLGESGPDSVEVAVEQRRHGFVLPHDAAAWLTPRAG